MESDNKDSWVHGRHRGRDERLGGGYPNDDIISYRGAFQEYKNNILIPFTDGVAEGGLEDTGVVASSPFESPLIVEVDDDRPNDEVKGARCVSFNSLGGVVSLATVCIHCSAERGIGKGERETNCQ